MNKNIANAMGMTEPERATYEVAGNKVESEVLPALRPGANVPALPEMVEDNERIREGDKQVDDVIAQGMVALRETFEEAGDMEPRSKSRAREVGAQIMMATLNAIKHKQDFAVKNKQQRMKEATWGADGVTSVSNTQINNIVASRNDIMKLLKEEQANGEEEGQS